MPRRPLDPHRFWRDPALPMLEARVIGGGRAVCYEPHSHPTFAIGVITGGRSEFVLGRARYEVTAGTVVAMNPDEAHACNPLPGVSWSYAMLFADRDWLAGVQGRPAFTPYAAAVSTDAGLAADIDGLVRLLMEGEAAPAAKEEAAAGFFAGLHERLGYADDARGMPEDALARAAAFIAGHCAEPLRLADICAASGLSPSYLVRAFKARYGLTPHAYQVNRRVRLGQERLREGSSIVEAALEAGFADQAHFQRAFKRLVAATPGQFAGRQG
ncbi:MAG TPA: AraC family transcriptional regulator [Azospirillaceae bacterium]|nr:AraC family transcriptional regulator [Azospirillaceae bacterium]